MVEQTVADVMTPAPIAIGMSDTLESAARTMAAQGARALVVQSGPTAVGILTDRDLVVHGLAEGLGLEAKIGEVVSEELVTVRPNVPAEMAFRVMRVADVRRIPVMDGDTPVGILSMGDPDVGHDSSSALAAVAAEPHG